MQQSLDAPTNYTYTKDIARFQSFFSKINENEGEGNLGRQSQDIINISLRFHL